MTVDFQLDISNDCLLSSYWEIKYMYLGLQQSRRRSILLYNKNKENIFARCL